MSFERYLLDRPDNLFHLLYQSAKFEEFSKGRELAVLHRPEKDKMPLVRTTTIYQTPSQPFSAIHRSIINEIKAVSDIQDLDFNNAMLEVYDSRYTTMGFHTDQALDLETDSFICVFSCYEKGADSHPRVLTVKNKYSREEFELQLLHHSAVVFSTGTNRTHLHKIEGKGLPNNHSNRWMGFTLRLSKTFVKSINGVPSIVLGDSELGELTIATEQERKAFYGFKGQENKRTDFEYPEIRYTISPSDRMTSLQ